jgi:hypothetical protein
MRTLPAAILTALADRRLVARDFLWIIARNRETGAPEAVGFWSDVGAVSAAVINPNTGLSVTRNFYGSGTLIDIDPIPLVSTLEVQNIRVRMSQIDSVVQQAVRDYDCKQAKVEIFRGLFSPDTRQLVSPAEPRFVGFVDEIDITTPSENEDGGVTLTCASHTQEILRSNPDTRSDASQRLRHSDDAFYKDTATVGDWELFWGRKQGKIETQKVSERLVKASLGVK